MGITLLHSDCRARFAKRRCPRPQVFYWFSEPDLYFPKELYMSRDDFALQIKTLLAQRVGVRCSNPNCRQQTSGPQINSDKVLNVGVAAHITAAAEGGPRYDSVLTQAQLQSIENGIWLFQT